MALLVVALLFGLPAIARAVRIGRGSEGNRARLLLAFALRRLPPDRADWARAMLVEFDHVEGRREQWQYSAGCTWVAARLRIKSREPGGTLLRVTVVGCAVLACLLVGYGLVHYPGLRSEPNVWGAMAAFLATLTIYITLALLLSRGMTPASAAARRYGMTGGLAVAVGWLAGITPPSALRGWVFLPLLVALLGPAVVAGFAGYRTRDSRTGTLAALWSGLVGGLGVFVVWVAMTYADAGRPYDAGLVSDFHRSGAHDLATYAIGDDLGSGLVLLLMVPTVALAVGSVSARLRSRSPNPAGRAAA